MLSLLLRNQRATEFFLDTTCSLWLEKNNLLAHVPDAGILLQPMPSLLRKLNMCHKDTALNHKSDFYHRNSKYGKRQGKIKLREVNNLGTKSVTPENSHFDLKKR